jgi:hypothetical protein
LSAEKKDGDGAMTRSIEKPASEISPPRIWIEGELREYDIVVVGDRRLAVVREPRMNSPLWALPGGFSDDNPFDAPSFREFDRE